MTIQGSDVAAPRPGSAASVHIAHWDSEAAERLVSDVVGEHFKLGMFHHFPDIEDQDVIQELLRWAYAEFPKFNPARAKFSTWIVTFAKNRIHNINRGRSRVAKQEAKACSGREYADEAPFIDGGASERRVPVCYPEEIIDPPTRRPGDGETLEGECVGGDLDLPLVDWLSLVYREARRLTADASRERMSYEPAQRVAVAALGRKLNWSVRGIRGVFEDRADLRRAVGFSDLPCRDWFWRALGADQTLSRKN